MHYSDRSISPLSRTFGAEFPANPAAVDALSSGSFVQCPSALLQSMSEEQKRELASLYQRAFAKALESVQNLPFQHPRFPIPLNDSLRGIGWN